MNARGKYKDDGSKYKNGRIVSFEGGDTPDPIFRVAVTAGLYVPSSA